MVRMHADLVEVKHAAAMRYEGEADRGTHGRIDLVDITRINGLFENGPGNMIQQGFSGDQSGRGEKLPRRQIDLDQGVDILPLRGGNGVSAACPLHP